MVDINTSLSKQKTMKAAGTGRQAELADIREKDAEEQKEVDLREEVEPLAKAEQIANKVSISHGAKLPIESSS